MRLGGGGGQANASAAHPLLQRQPASAPSAPTVHTRVVGRIEGRHLPNHPRGLRLSRGDGAGPEFRLSFMEAQDLNFISGHNRQAPQRRWNEVSGNSVNASTIEDALLHMLTVNEQGSEAEGAQEGTRLPHSRANDGFEQYLERVNSRAQERNGMPFSPFPLPASLRAAGLAERAAAAQEAPASGPEPTAPAAARATGSDTVSTVAVALDTTAVDSNVEESEQPAAQQPEQPAEPAEAAMDSELMAAIAMSMEVDQEEQPAPPPAEPAATEAAEAEPAAAEEIAATDQAPAASEDAAGK